MDPERTKLTAPERIYLGYTSFWYETSEEGLHDIEYVRADLFTTTSDSARRAAEEWYSEVRSPYAKNAVAELTAIISKHFAAAPADNDAESLLQHIACSGVEFDDSRMGYVVVQIDRDVWERIKKLAPATTTKGDR